MAGNFITDDNVSAALDYLAIDPHPVAEAKYDLMRAENERKRIYAQQFMEASKFVKTVAEREAWALLAPEYVAAQENEALAAKELEKHKSKTNSASTITDMWRSVNANARAAEKIR
jgi:hypothetical protein